MLAHEPVQTNVPAVSRVLWYSVSPFGPVSTLPRLPTDVTPMSPAAWLRLPPPAGGVVELLLLQAASTTAAIPASVMTRHRRSAMLPPIPISVVLVEDPFEARR